MLRLMTHEEENISRSVCSGVKLDTGQTYSILRDEMLNRSSMSYVLKIWVNLGCHVTPPGFQTSI